MVRHAPGQDNYDHNEKGNNGKEFWKTCQEPYDLFAQRFQQSLPS